MSKPEVWWIAERSSCARTTIMVKARTKREAQKKLDAGHGQAVDTSFSAIGRAIAVRRDRKPKD